MALDRSSVTRFLARGAALSFALLASCYLIYSAQRRADTNEGSPQGGEAGAAATGAPALMPSSKVLVVEDPSVMGADATAAGPAGSPEAQPVLLGTSKSMSPDALEALPEAWTLAPGSGATTASDESANPTFLPSSKVLILDAPLTTTQGTPATPSFLGGTKSAVISSELLRSPHADAPSVPAPPAHPETTNAAPKKPQVFLPSSKSFRMRESPPPAAQPVEPQAPPDKKPVPEHQLQSEPRS